MAFVDSLNQQFQTAKTKMAFVDSLSQHFQTAKTRMAFVDSLNQHFQTGGHKTLNTFTETATVFVHLYTQ